MKRIIIGVLAIFTSLVSNAFSGSGLGTEQSPYLITSANELFEMRSDLNAHYKLMNDIDLGAWIEDNSPIQGWIPIGTVSSPFNGVFDGNEKAIKNLFIKRENSDNIGLFGFVQTAILKNIVLLNTDIIGHDNVAALIGNRNVSTNYDQIGLGQLNISNCYVVGGYIKGNNCIGGIIGRNEGSGNGNAITIDKCHNSANIKGVNQVGGICGYTEGWGSSPIYIRNSYSIGNINGNDNVGGIVGYFYSNYTWISKYDCGRPDLVCEKNYVRGNIIGLNNTNGIAGYSTAADWVPGSWGAPTVTGIYTMASNVCIADTLQGQNRISSNVSSSDNYASNNTIVVLSNGGSVDVEDNQNNGTSMSVRLLQKSTTYQSLNWDFYTTWRDMSSNDEYPILKNQSAAPIVESFESKSKGSIKGTAPFANGTIYVIIKKNMYESPVEDGKWNVSLGNIVEKEEATVFACENGKIPSATIHSFAEKKEYVPDIILGDSNSDSVVDAADVVCTTNYILGKPSSSFNDKNADVNNDGQILIDDAVGTVNIIMNEQ